MDEWIEAQYPDGFTGTVTLAMTYGGGSTGDDAGGGTGSYIPDDALDDLTERVGKVEGAVSALTNTIGQQPGTVYPVLEDYYIANIEAAKPGYYAEQGANTLTFAMMSDIHVFTTSIPTVKNVEAASAWSKLVNHDFVVLGGDLIDDSRHPDKQTALSLMDTVLEMTEKHAACPVYAVKGNHDTNELAGANAWRITDKEFYLHANARGEKHNMVTDAENPYGGYYYVDFPRQKIRMVCLNTSETYPDVNIYDESVGDANFRWIGAKSANQLEWVANTALQNLAEGWAVMMVSHIPPFKAENFANRGTDNPALISLCEAFVNGAQGSVTGEKFESGEKTSVTIPYDFTQQGAREFIGHFCGHAHVDAYNRVGDTNYVIVNCTMPSKKDDSGLYLDRTADADKLSLNSFIIDRATRTVKCIKIGAAPSADNENWKTSFTW